MEDVRSFYLAACEDLHALQNTYKSQAFAYLTNNDAESALHLAKVVLGIAEAQRCLEKSYRRWKEVQE